MTIKELIKDCILSYEGEATLSEIYNFIYEKTKVENTTIRSAAIRGTLYSHLIGGRQHTDIFERNSVGKYTLNKDITDQETQKVLGTVDDEISLEEEIIQGSAYDFHLEKHLEDFLLSNLFLLERGLRLVENGRQFRLEATNWYIDLLAKDINDNYVVIELKKGNNNDQVVGQILRYIGYIKEIYNTEKVRGIIVTHESDNKLYYATKAVDNIQLKEYEILFNIKNSHG